jgi:hypothetical protein
MNADKGPCRENPRWPRRADESGPSKTGRLGYLARGALFPFKSVLA